MITSIVFNNGSLEWIPIGLFFVEHPWRIICLVDLSQEPEFVQICIFF